MGNSLSSLSHYGIMNIIREPTGPYLELFVPELMLKQLEIRPGSKAMLQGLLEGNEEEFYLRSRTGIEELQLEPRLADPAAYTEADRIPFTAAVRLPNEPKVLHRFLTLAQEADIRFHAIRTYGYRGKHKAEVVIEGSVPNRSAHFVYRHTVQTSLERIVATVIKEYGSEIDGGVINHELLQFKRVLFADVSSTVYGLDVPVLRDRFLKVRVNVNTKVSEAFGESLALTRLGLDLNSMTIAISTDLKRQRQYILVFEGRGLKNAPPVTRAILEDLPKGVNVDAISAYEFLAFDPKSTNPRELAPMGRLEMLCVTSGIHAIDCKKTEKSLRKSVERTLVSGDRIEELSLKTIDEYFDDLRRSLARPDEILPEGASQKLSIFKEYLDDRYVRLERLGSGTFGQVYRYLDLVSGEMVAAKHFPKHEVGSQELKALVARAWKERSPNLVEFKKYFFDGAVPVIVTELLPVTLSKHENNRQLRDSKAVPHRHPRNLYAFLQMATQVCSGLQDLHARVQASGEYLEGVGYTHGDVKPANIGAAMVENKLTWKLIDFGLAKEFAQSREETDTIKGTLAYMSPQIFGGVRGPSDDIFALGVTFFEVLCDWQHPTRSMTDRGPIEVREYVDYLNKATHKEPSGYDEKRWRLAPQYDERDLPNVAKDELRTIVFLMMSMADRQRPTAEEAFELFVGWEQKYRDKLPL